MNRRDFLKRLSALGLVAASPKLIFDLGYKSHIAYCPEIELAEYGWFQTPMELAVYQPLKGGRVITKPLEYYQEENVWLTDLVDFSWKEE